MTLSELGLAEAPWIVGHRGAGGEAPENTLDSLLLAVEQGADMIECDVQMTADEWLVLSHDWDLVRMGGDPRVVEGSALAELEQIEVSGPFRSSARRRPLASLAGALALLPPEIPLNLELKRRRADRATVAGSLAGAIADRERVLVSSFDWPLLAAVRALLPSVRLAPLGGRSVDPAALLDAAEEVGAWSIHCRDSVADEALIAAARQAARPLLVYTVNDASRARGLFRRGVSGVFSDFPGRLRSDLEAAA